MAYLAGLIILGLFFLVLHYFTEITKSQKIIVSVTALVVIGSAIAHNSYASGQREHMMAVASAYKQGKTVTCQGQDINASGYTLSIGTYTFIGKKHTPNYTHMIRVSDCQ